MAYLSLYNVYSEKLILFVELLLFDELVLGDIVIDNELNLLFVICSISLISFDIFGLIGIDEQQPIYINK